MNQAVAGHVQHSAMLGDLLARADWEARRHLWSAEATLTSQTRRLDGMS
jgi:hypothetical protein